MNSLDPHLWSTPCCFSRRTAAWLLIVLCAFLAPSTGTLIAQQTAGTISGVISDPAGATIPGATVIVKNDATGVERETSSSAIGLYSVLDVPPASYEITVTANGFKKSVARSVQVVVDQAARLDFHLQLGDVSQAVEVAATQGPLLSTVSSKMDTVIETQQITELPLNGRQFAQLILLTPGALPITIGTATSFKVQLGAGSYAPVINGQRSRYNSFTLDGIENTDPMFNSYAFNPSVDAIQEFSVQSRGEAGEFARSMGSTVVVVTRSGTNQFHGAFWEFLRNSDLDARNFFDPERPSYKQNQFGATFGGPLRIPHYNGRNRTFFFGYYEGYRATRSANSITTVPTAAMEKGDFSAPGLPLIYDIATTQANPASQVGYTRSPFPGNIIPASRLDQNAVSIFSTVYPQPNRAGVSNNYINTTPNSTQNDQGSLRIDHKISDANTLFGRISYNNGSQLIPGGIPADYSNLTNVAWNSTVSDTHVFRSNLLLHTQFGVTRYTSDQIGSSLPSSVLSATGWNATYPSSAPSLLTLGLTMADAAGVNGQFTPIGPHTSYNSLADVTWVRGRHTLKFGFTWIDLHSFQASPQATINFTRAPTSNLINQQTTGYGPATFLLGLVTDSRRTIGDTSATLSSNDYVGFIQDEVRVTSKFTITAGLGYTYFQSMKNKGDLYAGLDYWTGVYLVATKNPVTGAPPNVRQRWVDPDWNNFAPRLGLAYLLGDKTTLRAGAGIFYSETDAVQMYGDPAGNWPFGNSQIIGPLNQYFADTTMEKPFQNSPTLTLPPNPLGQGGYSINPRMKTPYASEWNASVQRQLPASILAEVSYVGSNAVKLLNRILENNATSPGPGSVQARRQWPQYGQIRWDDNSAPANYNGLTLKLQKRFSHGITFLTSYTWSHALDVWSSDRGGVANGTQDPNNWRADYASSNGGITNAFVFNDVWELPFGPGRMWANSGMSAKILGGWQWSNILGFYGGQPVSIILGFDNANVGNVAQRPNLVGNPVLSSPTPQEWFNTAAFATPAPFTYGNAGRNIVRGPGIKNWDVSLVRNFRFSERMKLQFRAEAFNLPNFVNFGNPVGTYSASNFGQILSAGASRDIQFSLKCSF